jgi:hypothetical protein
VRGIGVATSRFISFRRRESTIESPDRVAHDAEADETRNEEVDVARARLSYQLVADRDRVHTPGRALDRAIGEHPRGPALRIGVVVTVDDGAARTCSGKQRGLSSPEDRARRRVVQVPHVEPRFAPERLRDRRVGCHDRHGIHRPAAERNPEPRRQENWKEHRPEDRFGLARELANPHERELDERVSRHGWSLRARVASNRRSGLIHRANDVP